jgi:hypothetical protein
MAHGAQKLPRKFEPSHKIKQQAFSEGMKKALTSLGLEGISLSKESLADLHLFDMGKISKEEALKRVVARVKSQKK